MYWIGGAGPARDEAHDTDFFATSQGHVSITPLQVDLTEHDQLMHWKTAAENWEKIA
jgi:5'-nucleotidase